MKIQLQGIVTDKYVGKKGGEYLSLVDEDAKGLVQLATGGPSGTFRFGSALDVGSRVTVVADVCPRIYERRLTLYVLGATITARK